MWRNRTINTWPTAPESDAVYEPSDPKEFVNGYGKVRWQPRLVHRDGKVEVCVWRSMISHRWKTWRDISSDLYRFDPFVSTHRVLYRSRKRAVRLGRDEMANRAGRFKEVA